jgi:hypothetical protein
LPVRFCTPEVGDPPAGLFEPDPGTVSLGVVTVGAVTFGVVTLGVVTVGVLTLGVVTVGVVTTGTAGVVTVGVVMVGTVTVIEGVVVDGRVNATAAPPAPSNAAKQTKVKVAAIRLPWIIPATSYLDPAGGKHSADRGAEHSAEQPQRTRIRGVSGSVARSELCPLQAHPGATPPVHGERVAEPILQHLGE